MRQGRGTKNPDPGIIPWGSHYLVNFFTMDVIEKIEDLFFCSLIEKVDKVFFFCSLLAYIRYVFPNYKLIA